MSESAISATKTGMEELLHDQTCFAFNLLTCERISGDLQYKKKGIHVKRDTLASVMYSEELKFR
jgi:hypothetical protein